MPITAEQEQVLSVLEGMNALAKITDEFSRRITGDEIGEGNWYFAQFVLENVDRALVPSKFVAALEAMLAAAFAPEGSEGDASRKEARETYAALSEEETELQDEISRRFDERFPPDMPDMETMLSGMNAGPRRHIRFLVGKYGRVDLFDLEGAPEERRIIGRLTCDDSDATLAALRVLDEAVRTDATTVFRGGNIWSAISNKQEVAWYSVERMAVPLYERRLIEQERILRGEIKRGHKAFGFYPLGGCR